METRASLRVSPPLDWGGAALGIGDTVEVMSERGTVWEPSWDTGDPRTVRELVLRIDETGAYWGVLLDGRRREYGPEFLRHAEEE